MTEEENNEDVSIQFISVVRQNVREIIERDDLQIAFGASPNQQRIYKCR